MNLYLHNELKKYFSSAEPLFKQLMQLSGECFRQLEGRVTRRVKLGEEHYFIKQHYGIGWKEVIKNLMQGRLPIVSANNEKKAIEKLQQLGISVPIIFGYGQSGCNPATIKSFILLKELAPTISLEDLVKQWPMQAPTFKFKVGLIKEVARIARIMHEHGINHRDFYICHFLLDQASSTLKLYLIDLHRAQIRNKTPVRWLIKDLAGLYFSSLNIGLTQRDYYRFICQYHNKRLKEIMQTELTFWQKVKQRGEQLFRRHGS